MLSLLIDRDRRMNRGKKGILGRDGLKNMIDDDDR